MASDAINSHKRPLIVAGTTTALIFLFYLTGLLGRLEGMSYDQLTSFSRAGTTIHPDVEVVLIDDNSLKAMDDFAGRWPWPRSIYADLLDFFALGEPRAVLFDIMFFEKQRDFNAPKDQLNPHDMRLVEASASYPFAYHATRFVLADEDESNKNLLNKPLPEDFVNLFSLSERIKFFSEKQPEIGGLRAPSNTEYYLPFEELRQATGSVGVVDMNAENDGIYRTARLFHRYQDHFFPALSTAALVDKFLPEKIVREANTLRFGEIDIPLDEQERFWVNYYENYETFSFSGIIASLFKINQGELENLVPSPFDFKDKIIFVGASAAGLEDLKNTPMDARLPGVMIHASIASNILMQDFITPPNKNLTLALIILLALITSYSALMPKGVWVRNIFPVVIIVLYVATVIVAFFQQYVIELVAPSASAVVAWSISFSMLVFTEGKEKRRFKRMMSQYLSPAVLSTVVGKHEEFAKAEIGSKENLTILFSDIRSFTNMSESLPAEKVVDILNHYFSSMTDSIFRFEGTIDKFIGDAIMAFWGAPIKSDDHADKATLAALDMINRLENVNVWMRENNYPEIQIGIGLHTGDAILGNIGSENKLDYTIIGDNVNLASRIEGLTKAYASPILLTEGTFEKLQTPVICRIIDLVRVKGKKKPIRIYRPLLHPELTQDEAAQAAAKQEADLAETAFNHYLAREWTEALEVLRRLPEDLAAQILMERCELYLKTPPAADWDGVHTMKTK